MIVFLDGHTPAANVCTHDAQVFLPTYQNIPASRAMLWPIHLHTGYINKIKPQSERCREFQHQWLLRLSRFEWMFLLHSSHFPVLEPQWLIKLSFYHSRGPLKYSL